jgi:ubiquinone/menaquinone biosynthesis C-methylase UbiE
MKVDYDDRQHAVYVQGRALTPQTISTWMEAFARHAGHDRPLDVVDLGSGTGRFTPALAETFGGSVCGVEPSRRMRAIAEETAAHPRVRYQAGTAANIPLPGRGRDLVLLYLVLHHIPDHQAAAAEIARILRPGGRLLIRSIFSDRLPELPWHRYFTRARALEAQIFPTLAEVKNTFSAAGFQFVTLDQVRQQTAPSLAAYAERLHLRALSTFEHLTEQETTAGFAAMDAAVERESVPRPVEEDCDLLVLQLNDPPNS